MTDIEKCKNYLYSISIAEDRPINKKKTIVRFYLEDLAKNLVDQIDKVNKKLNK